MHRISARHPTLFALGFSIVLSLAVAACTPAPPPAGPKAQAQVKYATATPVGAAPAGAAPAGAPYSPALTTFATDDFSGSGQCVMCHSMLADASGARVSITDDWRSTMMANSSKDPVWQAKVASEVARNPHLTEVIEKKCGACHTPMASVQADVAKGSHALLGEGFLSRANSLHAAALDGVSCSLCHQIQPGNMGQPESFSGGYEVDTSTAPPDRIMFGHFENPVVGPMQMHTGYYPAFGEHAATSELCATCHNLVTPYVDAKGEVAGEFPEQMPYTEWQNSAFGQGKTTCQACHMPLANGGVIISPMPAVLQPREPFYQHYFAGGNLFGLKLLKDNLETLGVTALPEHMDATIERTGKLLAAGATLTLEKASHRGDEVELQLRLTAGTGHKFPTSFPSRRAWLHVTVKDAAGNMVFESGQPQADGSIAGNAADAGGTAFEPHYDVVTAEDQVQIYEPIMGDTEGQPTYTLLRGASYLKDNRLLPAGADKASLPEEIAVAGEAASDANFVGGADLVTYRIDTGRSTGPYTVEAELLYQPLSYRFLQDLLTDQSAAGDRLEGLLQGADQAPARVAAIVPRQID